MADRLFGRRVPRVEDARLLRGHGRYLDDVPLPGALEVAILRSPHAHARIVSVDAGAARDLPGVVAVVDAAALAGHVAPLANRMFAGSFFPEGLRRAADLQVRTHEQPLLASGRVVHVGQPVAAVVAASRYVAEDALELIDVTYEPLPVAAAAAAALAPGAPALEPTWPDNVAVELRMGTGDVDAALASAAVVVSEALATQRQSAVPMETRGVAAAPGPDGALTVWSSTQVPHQLRDLLAAHLGMDPRKLNVVAPDVGGGFGPKGVTHPEDVLVPWLAQMLGRPVKWVEDRTEHLSATVHAREQLHEVTLAATEDGTILAATDDFVVDAGAFSVLGALLPLNTVSHFLGPYVVPNVALRARAVLTNTAPTAPYRGAGRPEAVFAMERMIDRLAARLGLDPVEVRRRNLVPAERMPYDTGLTYRDGTPEVYDSGDYPELLRRAVKLAGHDAVRRSQPAEGTRRTGIGYAAYVEGTAVGPFESASVTVEPSGGVRVATGASSQGQGHQTTLAQIVADALEVPLERVEVVGGDSAALPFGFGTIASRSLVLGGNAASQAAAQIRELALGYAAELLEAAPEDLELTDGTIRIKGVPKPALTLGDLAGALTPWNPGRPPGAPAELRAEAHFRPPTVTWSAAVHAAVVEVDVDTGVVEVRRYVVVHDAGRIVNPTIVEGQITGGVAQGIGGALYEEIAYDEEGQLRTGSLMDYLLPTAGEMPEFILDHIETPSPRNPLGVKGLGEGGAIGPPAAIANAVEDALRGYGVVVRGTPLSPDRVRALVRGAVPADQ